MGRKRRSDIHLPQRVYRRRGVFYWFPLRKDAERLGKTAVRLGATLAEAMLKWTELAEGTTCEHSMSDLMDRYILKVAPRYRNSMDAVWYRIS